MFKARFIEFREGVVAVVVTTTVVAKSALIVGLTILVPLLLNATPVVSAQPQYGAAPCGYTVKYYSYYYPYVYSQMNFVFYTYPAYYPNPVYQLTVSSSPPNLPVSGSGQFCKDQSAQFSVTSSTYDLKNGTRYVFTGWSGDYFGTSATGEVTMSVSKAVVANFKTQHLLTVTSSYGNASGSGWYDIDTTAYASLDKSIVDVSAGVRVKFAGWSGDVSDQSIPVAVQMTGPKTVTAQWKTQYYLSVSSKIGQAEGSGWYDSGTQITISVNSPVPAGFGSQYVFDRWAETSGLQTTSAQLTVNGPMTIEGTWRLDQTQLYETIAAIAAGILIAAIAGWFVFIRKRRIEPEKT